MFRALTLLSVLCSEQLLTPSPAAPVEQGVVAQWEGPLIDTVPDRGAVLYYQAAMKERAGDPNAALRLLKQCLSFHEGFDPSGSLNFKSLLKDRSDWLVPLRRLHREFPSTSHSRLAFITQERDLVPEGMAYNAALDIFYLSSLNRRKIIMLSADGTSSDFVPAGRDGLLPILGIRMDPIDGSVWANSWSEDEGRSELLHFEVSGRLLGRYAVTDAAKHGFNDLVVRKNGTVLLTDSLSNEVYQFDPGSGSFTAIKLHRLLNEPNGIALSEDDTQLFVADDFGIQLLDLRSNIAAEVPPGVHNTLAGVDGLYWHRGWLIGIQNAIGSPRIAAFLLSKDGTTIVRTTVLEYRSTFLTGEPTTGAIKGNELYFIVNSQGENMNGDHVADPEKLEPVRVGVLRLP